MLIEVGAPAALPLGLVKYKDETGSKTCLLGLTVQHPPIQIFAQAHETLNISGPRADVGNKYGVQFLQYHQRPYKAQAEIEFAIPNLVGLGSEALLGLGMAQALAWVHDLPEEAQTTLAFSQALDLEKEASFELWAFDQGGLLLIDLDTTDENGLHPIIRRLEIEHKEKEAWAFVFYFPDDTETISEDLETQRWTALRQAAPHLSVDTGRLVDEKLWPAVEQDDYPAFAESLARLHQFNVAALAQTGSSLAISSENQAVLDVMAANGSSFQAQNLRGHSFYGLTKGGQASRDLRKTLRTHVGFFGGTILATITDNRGAAWRLKNEDLNAGKLEWYRMKAD